MRLLRLKLGPREVQAKKNRSKILKSAIFELHKRDTPQKKAENNCQLDLKLEILFMKKLKKFYPKKNHNLLSISAEFLENLSR